MKRRVLAIILAGLLTASLSSCVASGIKSPDNGTKTEEEQTRDNSPETTTPSSVIYKDVDETVYVTTGTLNLRVSPSTTAGAKTAKQLTKLHRIKYSETWSVVEYEGSQYYASSKYLTTDDLLAENFTATNATMYVSTETLYVRKYPSADNAVSAIMGSLKQGEAVTVTATGGNNWVKIKYQLPVAKEGDTPTYADYFVNSKYLSMTKEEAEQIDYTVFIDCAETVMYATGNLNLRAAPTTGKAGTIEDTLVKSAKVIVVATGTLDGTNWCRVKVADKIKEGDTQTYSYYYASAKYLSLTDSSVPITLEDMLSEYPSFKAETKTLYVSTDALSVRSTPMFPSDNKNIVASLKKKDKVSVVAVGKEDNNNWCMIEYTPGVFYFVGSAALTPNPDGTPAPLTLDELLEKYEFTSCAEKTCYAKSKVNCYSAPANANTPAATLAAGDAVKVIATGSAGGTDWYLFKHTNGNYYFAGVALFTETAPSAG